MEKSVCEEGRDLVSNPASQRPVNGEGSAHSRKAKASKGRVRCKEAKRGCSTFCTFSTPNHLVLRSSVQRHSKALSTYARAVEETVGRRWRTNERVEEVQEARVDVRKMLRLNSHAAALPDVLQNRQSARFSQANAHRVR